MKMEFKIPIVKKFLEENGKVYTVRSFLMADKEVFVEGIGKCKREFIKEITKIEDLRFYIKRSGFYLETDNMVKEYFRARNEWWQTIERFCKGKPKYLYQVKVKVE